MMDRFVGSLDKIEATYGLYQVGILGPIVRLFFPNTDIWSRMTTELREINVFGFFISAWGAMYQDWGAIGMVMATIAWGMASGFAYRKTVLMRSPMAQVFLASFFCSFIVSPMNSPIAMSNSILIYAGFFVAAWLLSRRPRRDRGKYQPADQ
jgi:hypothetical protein